MTGRRNRTLTIGHPEPARNGFAVLRFATALRVRPEPWEPERRFSAIAAPKIRHTNEPDHHETLGRFVRGTSGQVNVYQMKVGQTTHRPSMKAMNGNSPRHVIGFSP